MVFNLLSNYFPLFLEYFGAPEIVVKEEIEINFANNEEAGPSGIVVKEEMETDEEAGINIAFLFYYNLLSALLIDLFVLFFDKLFNH